MELYTKKGAGEMLLKKGVVQWVVTTAHGLLEEFQKEVPAVPL